MRKSLYLFVIAIGLLQIIGYLLNNKPLRGLGMAWCSSPLPIVFTEVRGVETFASDFFIQYSDENGTIQTRQITPELYSKLNGPYNRRNVYGAAISYGPVLKKELWESVLNYGLCTKILLKELELPETGAHYSVLIKTKTSGRKDQWILTPTCAL